MATVEQQPGHGGSDAAGAAGDQCDRGIGLDILPALKDRDSSRRRLAFLLHRRSPARERELPLRSYTSSTGVSPLRKPCGEGASDRSSGGLVITTVE
ncbi:hypothetical protein, partial [Nonomuraea mesophila]|uniref:hypothetical protein n=1 Tax=Nonomuraea mesophila TaxID=2530382 RepID=UPI001C701F29